MRNDPPVPHPENENIAEQVCNHPLVERAVTMAAQNARNNLFTPAEGSAEIYNRATDALNAFARDITDKMLHAHLAPFDMNDPDWTDFARKLIAAFDSVGITVHGGQRNETAALLFGKFIDEFEEFPPERWTDDASVGIFERLTNQMLESVGTVAYFLRIGLDPNLIPRDEP